MAKACGFVHTMFGCPVIWRASLTAAHSNASTTRAPHTTHRRKSIRTSVQTMRSNWVALQLFPMVPVDAPFDVDTFWKPVRRRRWCLESSSARPSTRRGAALCR